MAEVVATMAIRPLVSMLMNKSSSYLLDKYKVMEGMEEQHKVLKRQLPAILDVITDAEEQAIAHREGAKAWLQELKAVAYEANEVFDEFKYEALRREAKKNGHYRELGWDVIKLLPTHNRVVFRHKMGTKLCHILRAIEVLIAQMQAFGFKYQPQPPVSKEWRQTDYVIVDPQEIASRSRHKDKRNIVGTLLRQANNADLTVVPIVGMGGLGKTTLAQLIYNESEIQKHFQLLLWVCVSDNFDVNALARSIVEASPKKNDDTDKPPLDRLQKLVSGQRYILVLDDVWNNREFHKWERLKVCLQHGGSGSVVLTTTRDKQVAEMMGAGRAYHLNDLEDTFLKEIIEARAFSSEKEKPTELVEMVGEIVKRCCGSPLAATALGSVLRTKTSLDEWKAISSRSSICTEEIGILPILKLSYNDLPSYMKQCFAFCAVFPKDYKIDVEKLIQLWIANAFIPKRNEDSLETTGRHTFNELASRSFFLDIDEDKDSRKYYSRTTCKIHDLMHDIAMSVMENECVVATEESSQTEWLPDTARHLFLSCRETEGILNDSVEKRSPFIQTLLCDRYVETSLQHLSKYSSLHALKLYIRTESFRPKPKYLHHLRYLDLSDSSIKSLPGDIGILYNLQMLDLSNCEYLVQLPRQIKYMTSLRHLYTHGCSKLKSMPPELGKLTELQTLTYFVAAVNSPDCSDVAELQNLNLCGQLELSQVENVTEAEAKVANLGTKKDLRDLRLRWTSVSDSEVLSRFKPHDGLEVLWIYSYGGKCMGMLQNMVEIHLSHCERLQVLVRCGTSFTFPKLKLLRLEHLLDFERWWEINERQEGQIIFPVLEELFIRSCGKLTALPEAALVQEPCSGGHRSVWSPFPVLGKFFLRYCRRLIALPEAPLLQEHSGGGFHSAFPAIKILKLEDLDSFQRWDAVVGGEHVLFPQLEKLSIEKCPKLIDLPKAPKLSVLEIEDGKQEMFHLVDRYLSSLTKLTLRLENTEITSGAECTSMLPVDSREKWNQKSPLTVLWLGCCNSFFGSGGLEPWDYFVHLGVLRIDRCDVLIHWPEVVFDSLIFLKRLEITRCNHLTGYAQGPVQPSAYERSQHLPALEYLLLKECASLVEMFNVPASLKSMTIMLCSKLESIFGKQQVGMSELVQGSSCSEAVVPTAVSQLSSSPVNHFCPYIEYLWLNDCDSLLGVLHLPPSLNTIIIWNCSSIQVLSCQLDGLPKPEVTASINAPDPSTATAAGEHSLPPCLTRLNIRSCAGMLGGILRLPTSLNHLTIKDNSGLTSLEPVSGPPPLSLECVFLESCSTLASLPDEPQAYGSLWNLEIGILPILKLSYNDLPSYMKQCFAFCAVFPKDYKIDVEKLIQLWIANAFIPKHNEDSLETTGRHTFNELASRSFFLDIEEDKDSRKYYSRKTCKIHDLMHDIAMSVMENECVVATKESSQTEWLPDTARHLFLSCRETEGILNDSVDKRSPSIQTLLCDRYVETSLQHLSKYSSLHALKLYISTESFRPKPKYLHHLRYLDLSESSIKSLPGDIGILYNLQMLDLSNCEYLVQLPRQIKYMTSLRHLYTHGCSKLKSMPPELGKLTELQTLTYFVAAVNSPDCSDVAELQNLNLCGQLELSQVENVTEAEAKVANLGTKKDLRDLRLRWTSVSDSEVLDSFKPHDGLEVLRIYSYGGKCMGMLQNMVEIHLSHCERLQVLLRCGTSFTFPKLKLLRLEHLLDFERWWEINEKQEGQLIFPVLEELLIRSCGKLIALPEAALVQEPCSGDHRSVWSPFPVLGKFFLQYCRRLIALPEEPLLQEHSGGGFRSAFPALKILKLEDLESFQRWEDAVRGEPILFPQLEKLSIHECPKLIDLPEAPKLSVLEIEDGKQEIFHWVDRYLSSLTELTLRLENTETTSGAECTLMLPVDSREKWNQKSPLTVMELGCCNSFFGSGGLQPWDYFVHLGVLAIDRCDVLVYWPEVVFNSLVSLKTLEIRNCNHLTGYTQDPVQPSSSKRSQHLPALESLHLEMCASLVEMFNVPASLKSMTIMWCSKLESIFGKQQVGTSELVQGSSCSEPIVPTAVSQLASSPVNHFCPYLEYLWLSDYDSLLGVLHLPPSLKTITIWNCSSIQVLSCQLDGLPKPEVTASINAPGPSAAGEHSLPPCLTSLKIRSCAGMLGGILRLPTSLKTLSIKDNSGLTSLEPVSGQPLSLERLFLESCSTLASLPNEPQAYGSLQLLEIKDYPAIKKLPRCLQLRLGNINEKDLDAQYEVMAFKPNTWKEIPRLVREQKLAKRRAERRRQANRNGI